MTLEQMVNVIAMKEKNEAEVCSKEEWLEIHWQIDKKREEECLDELMEVKDRMVERKDRNCKDCWKMDCVRHQYYKEIVMWHKD